MKSGVNINDNKERDRLFTIICDRLAEGYSLRKACLEEGLSRTIFYSYMRSTISNSWSKEDAARRVVQYTTAIEERSELFVEDMIDIADGVNRSEDSAEKVQRDRLSIDTRKWIAGKHKASKYGQNIQAEVTIQVEQPLFSSDD
ncbi:MAG: hypothetical protein HRS51_02910 [Candidatus Nitrosopelagicus sp.]|nr:hypothetical protein [Candidatus Nitrosopelagicus sp.]